MRVSRPGDEVFPRYTPGWDLRDEPPEEAPVVVYRLTPEEIAARYGPPRPRPVHTGMAGVAYALAQPMQPLTLGLLRRLAAEGLTAEEIAARLGRTAAGVRMRARQWGVVLMERRWPADKEELAAAVQAGLRPGEIARRYGVKTLTVVHQLRRYGLIPQPTRRGGEAAGEGRSRAGGQAAGGKRPAGGSQEADLAAVIAGLIARGAQVPIDVRITLADRRAPAEEPAGAGGRP